jgi:hypothetical protein
MSCLLAGALNFETATDRGERFSLTEPASGRRFCEGCHDGRFHLHFLPIELSESECRAVQNGESRAPGRLVDSVALLASFASGGDERTSCNQGTLTSPSPSSTPQPTSRPSTRGCSRADGAVRAFRLHRLPRGGATNELACNRCGTREISVRREDNCPQCSPFFVFS